MKLACILLLFHGGGFVQGAPGTTPDVVAVAPAHCRVVDVDYRLGGLA
jgi:acetyl esterase/lipase